MNQSPDPDHRDDQLRPWLDHAARRIADRLADARRHAEAGDVLTATLRIDELRRDMTDDLSDARATFWRTAFTAEPFDERVHRVIEPTPEGEAAARHAPISRRNQYADLRHTIDAASVSLRALGDAAKAADPGNTIFWETAFAAWLKRTTSTVTERMHVALSDSQMALSEAVARVRIKPGN